jgi:PKHD-type hydroxylase
MSASYPFIAQHRTNLDHYNYYYFTNAFSDEEIKALHQVAGLFPKQPGLTGASADGGETEYRVSEISWLHETNDTMWIYNKISELAMAANQQMWNYDIWGYHDSLQYTTYFDKGGHYDWHGDLGPGMSNRKLSCVLQLSDPTEYDGGDLQFNTGSQIVTVPKEKGTITFFSSFTLHRVTPVTRGKRQTLVTWLSGPNLR